LKTRAASLSFVLGLLLLIGQIAGPRSGAFAQHASAFADVTPGVRVGHTAPEESRDAIWHAAVARAVVPASFHDHTGSDAFKESTPASSPTDRTLSSSRHGFDFSRPHDPLHLHACALRI